MSLFKSLLFLHGHIVRPEDVELLAGNLARPSRANPLGPLRFLGGRPMHAGHNYDVEEPFELPPITRDPLPRCPELAGCG